MWTKIKSIRAKMEPMAKLRSAGKAIVGTITSVYGLGMVRGKIMGFIASFVVGIGLVPALVIGFDTKQPKVDSVRTDEIKSLLKKISVLDDPSNQSYIVVEGDKGVGKSCLIETALNDTKGVVQVKITPGTKEMDVLDLCTSAIAGGSYPFLGFLASSPRAKFVIYWHRRIFGYAPTLLLSASEVPPGSVTKEPAELTGAVRTLTEMGLTVIVDSSPNSLPKGILSTERARVIHVEDMTSEQIRSMPEVANLFDRLDAHPGLFDVVYDLLGGNPARFKDLNNEDKDSLSADTDVRTAVEALCVERLGDVRQDYMLLTKRQPMFVNVFKLFKIDKALKDSVLNENDVELPSPSKLLQLKGVPPMVIPKTSMAAFYFENSCDIEASCAVLHKLIWEPPTPSPPPTSQPSSQP